MCSKHIQIIRPIWESAITLPQLKYRPTNDRLQLDLQMDLFMSTIVLGLINME